MIALFYKYFGSKKGFLKLLRSYFYAIRNRRVVGWDFSDVSNSSRVIFVCKGNICRSALALEIFKQKLSDIDSDSFGLDTTTGVASDRRFSDACRTRGYDLNSHRATDLADFKIRNDDLLVCMEPQHASELTKKFGEVKVILLGGSHKCFFPYIHDPFCSRSDYLPVCIERIENSIDILVQRLNHERRP